MTHISIPYGIGYQEADLDDTKVAVEILDPSVKKVEKTPEELIEAALDHPIGTKRLEEMVVPEDKITIMVDDQTRPGPHTSMCRALIRRLNEAGVPDQNICNCNRKSWSANTGTASQYSWRPGRTDTGTRS